MSDGAKLSGQQLRTKGNFIVPFTEQEQDYRGPNTLRVTGAEGTAATEIIPTDRGAAKVRTYDFAAVAADLAASSIKIVGKTVVRQLPNVLTAYTVTYTKSGGNGASNYPTSQQAAVNAGSIAPRATAQASAVIQPTLTWTMTYYEDLTVDCTHVFLYLASGTTLATILAALTTVMGATVLGIPFFRPDKGCQITLKGEQVSVQQTATSTLHFQAGTPGSASSEYGDSYSTEVAPTIRIETLPPHIRGAVSLTGSSSDTKTATTTVVANITAAGSVSALITNAPAAITLTATGSISPTSLAATSVTAVPVTGLYLTDINGEEDEFGLNLIHCVVVDFAQYA